LAKLARGVQFGLLAALALGDGLFQRLGIHPLPEWYVRNVATNRFGTGMVIWFVGNLVTQQLTATSAFEVYANGQLVSVMASLFVSHVREETKVGGMCQQTWPPA
jgi:hypothetical protein